MISGLPRLSLGPSELGAGSYGWREEALPRPAGDTDLVGFTLPAPSLPPELWLSADLSGDAAAWLPPAHLTPGPRSATPASPVPAPPTDSLWVGLGVAALLTASGAGRFAELKAAAAQLGARIAWSPNHPPPRLFGGLSFAPGDGEKEPWTDLGDAYFVLPRIAYEWTPRGAWVHGIAQREELATLASRRKLLERLERRFAAASQSASLDPVQFPCENVRSQPPNRSEFAERVASIQAQIRLGKLGKAVAACQTHLELNPRPDFRRVLAALRSETGAIRFAIQRKSSCFLGAAPETLVHKRGLAVFTEAVAGSASLGLPGSASRLLASRKDRREHAFVVEALLDGLSPWVDQVSHPPEPVVRELRQVAHLLTPISGRLREERHVLDLVERLHPTPAVGGTPRDAALRAIRELEPVARGWYAAPVGWFDLDGDGAFAVALRSGLLRDHHAYLSAGAGIVSESEAEAEYDEINLKLGTLKSALGVCP